MAKNRRSQDTFWKSSLYIIVGTVPIPAAKKGDLKSDQKSQLTKVSWFLWSPPRRANFRLPALRFSGTLTAPTPREVSSGRVPTSLKWVLIRFLLILISVLSSLIKHFKPQWRKLGDLRRLKRAILSTQRRSVLNRHGAKQATLVHFLKTITWKREYRQVSYGSPAKRDLKSDQKSQLLN